MKKFVKHLKAAWRIALRAVGLVAHGFFRGLGLLLLFLILLGITGYFALQRILDEEGVKSIVVAQMQEVFRRPVQVDGVVLTPHGIKVRGIRVLDRSGVPGGPFLQSEFALVTLKPMPLLERRVELGNVRLVAPRIHFYRDEGGKWNVGDLFVSTRAAAAPLRAGPLALPFSLAAERMVIEHGMIAIDDHLRNRRFTIQKFDMTVKGFDVNQPFALSVSFDNKDTFGPVAVATSWSFDGSMFLSSFDWAKAVLRTEKLKVSVDGTVIHGDVTVKGFPQAEINADLRVPALGPRQIDRYFPKPVEFSMPASRWKARVFVEEPRALRFESLQIKAAPLDLAASGRIDLSQDDPELSGDIELGEFPLAQASQFIASLASYRLGGMAHAQLTLSGWFGRLIAHRGTLSARGIAGNFKEARISGGDLTASASKDFGKVGVRIARGSVLALGNSFTDVALSMDLLNKDLKIENLSLRWAGSAVKLKARVLNLDDPRQVMLDGAIDSVQWGDAQRLVETAIAKYSSHKAETSSEKKAPWLRTLKYSIPKKFPDILGHVAVSKITQANFNCANLDLFWDIKGISPTLKNLSGELKVGFGPGRVADIPTVQKSHDILRIVFLPFIFMHKMNNLSVLSAKTAYPKTLDFSRIEGEYGVKSGVATTRYFYVDSPQLVVYNEGIADFGREKVDMNILTRLTQYRGQLPEWWVDELGRPAIAFRVKGSLNDPDLEPRLRKMAANEIETMKEKGMSRAKAEFTTIEKLKGL